MRFKIIILCYLFCQYPIFSQIGYEKYENIGFEILTEEAQPISSTLLDSFRIEKSYYNPRLYKFPDGEAYLCDDYRETHISASYLKQRNEPSNEIEKRRPSPPREMYHYHDKLIQKLNECSIMHSLVYDEGHRRYTFLNCSHPDFDLVSIIRAINELKLKRKEIFLKGRMDYKAFYDNLYFYELENKLLVIWFDENMLFGNFMSYSGNWELDDPVLLLQSVNYIDKFRNSHEIVFDTIQNRSTNIFDLDIKLNENYFYISYSLELSKKKGIRFEGGFVKTLKLDKNLNILAEKQLPDTLTYENQYYFARRVRVQLLPFDGGLIHLIRVKRRQVGGETILNEVLNTDLGVTKETMTLDSLFNYKVKIPIEEVKDGFIITHVKRVNNRMILLAQKIDFNGKVSSPYIVYDRPRKDGSISSFMTRIVKNRILFYVQLYRRGATSVVKIYSVKQKKIK